MTKEVYIDNNEKADMIESVKRWSEERIIFSALSLEKGKKESGASI